MMFNINKYDSMKCLDLTSYLENDCIRIDVIAINLLYYILSKEIQTFLVKIKMLFLRSLERFISSREINLCRLDTFPTMVTNRPVMYNRVPAFGLLSLAGDCRVTDEALLAETT